MSDQQVKVGIAGLGFAGVEHLKGYQEYSRSEVLAVCDLNQEHAKQVAEEYEIPFIYTDHREMLANDDAVSFNYSVKPEFDRWQWVTYWYPLGQVVSFKQEVYRHALKELAPYLSRCFPV